MRINRAVALTVIIIVGIMLSAGCGAFRKPAPQQKPNIQVPQEPMPTGQEEVNAITSRLSGAADSVPGVNSAAVVVAGTTAYVGIDEKAGLEKGETDRVKRDVAGEVKKAEPRLTAVYVSSDPDTITRLRRIADGIAAGQPVSSFAGELTEIARRLSPMP
ncbi:YhcN/YlaJ family sporulation lipoprotein [Pelotomaculum propionicicum]|uniref:YhcN/YlaJ family sporulation lipoprotein n=1 Tax=Pelotomaculum propionicicum TaxID=258475 RepID=UPI003B779AE0